MAAATAARASATHSADAAHDAAILAADGDLATALASATATYRTDRAAESRGFATSISAAEQAFTQTTSTGRAAASSSSTPNFHAFDGPGGGLGVIPRPPTGRRRWDGDLPDLNNLDPERMEQIIEAHRRAGG